MFICNTSSQGLFYALQLLSQLQFFSELERLSSCLLGKRGVISGRFKLMRMDMPNLQTIHHFDVIIVGSGGAGLSLALSLPNHFNIAVLAKAALTEASTFYAQGGVAAS